jgi:hypothetical protein
MREHGRPRTFCASYVKRLLEGEVNNTFPDVEALLSSHVADRMERD